MADHCVAHCECETPKSPPGDYKQEGISTLYSDSIPACETPKSPPGDYKPATISGDCRRSTLSWCETPKSPPGDYKSSCCCPCATLLLPCRVKHLNPRQGITSTFYEAALRQAIDACETPKSPPGDYKSLKSTETTERRTPRCVKHLNPRQGITSQDGTSIKR